MNGESAHNNRTVCLRVVGAPHGVRGAFRVRAYTSDPADVAAYGPVSAGAGRRLSLKVLRVLKPGLVLASAPEVRNREAAEALKGAELRIDREALPAPADPDEFYVEDLVGLDVVTMEGRPAGKVAAVHDFGAGDILEIRGAPTKDAKGDKQNAGGGETRTVLVRFTKGDAPEVDLAGGRLVISEAALEEGEPAGPPPDAPSGDPAPDVEIADAGGRLVADDAAVNLDAMRAEDA